MEHTIMEQKKSFLEIVRKLIELTRSGDIKWVKIALSKKQVSDEAEIEFENAYKGIYKNWRLRLYTVKKVPKKGTKAGDLLIAFGQIFEARPPVFLELVDGEGKVEWTFPSLPEMNDLLEAIKYQLAGVQGFIESLFNNTKE